MKEISTNFTIRVAHALQILNSVPLMGRLVAPNWAASIAADLPHRPWRWLPANITNHIGFGLLDLRPRSSGRRHKIYFCEDKSATRTTTTTTATATATATTTATATPTHFVFRVVVIGFRSESLSIHGILFRCSHRSPPRSLRLSPAFMDASRGSSMHDSLFHHIKLARA